MKKIFALFFFISSVGFSKQSYPYMLDCQKELKEMCKGRDTQSSRVKCLEANKLFLSVKCENDILKIITDFPKNSANFIVQCKNEYLKFCPQDFITSPTFENYQACVLKNKTKINLSKNCDSLLGNNWK